MLANICVRVFPLASASRISQAGSTALHALQAKSHAPKAPAADHFADMLADADAAAATPPAEKADRRTGTAREHRQDDRNEGRDDKAAASGRAAANAPGRPARDNNKDDKAAATDNAAKNDTAKADGKDRRDAVNDNETAAQATAPQAPAAAPQQLAALAVTPATNGNDQPSGEEAQADAAAGAQGPGPQQMQALPADIPANGPQGADAATQAMAGPGTAKPETGFDKLLAAEKSASDSAAPAADKTDEAAKAHAAPADAALPAQTAPAQAGAPQVAVNAVAAAAAPAPNHLPAGASAAAAPQQAAAPSHTAHTPDVNGLAVAIFARSQSGAKQFDIRLDPPELGRVEVRLSIDAGGKAQAHLTADHSDTLTLLRQDAPALTRALREAGLDVSQDGLNFSLRGQQQQESGGQQGRGFSRPQGARLSASLGAAAPAADQPARRLGLLDIRV
jgi:flagellar hook-length control protein FliK